VYGKITTGAESDIQQLTGIARQMVGRWGMSDKLGPITVLPSDGAGPLLPGASETSQQTQWLVDQEVQNLVDSAHADVTELLTTHRSQLDGLAHALLVAETLDAEAAYAAAGEKMRPPEPNLEPEPDEEAAEADSDGAPEAEAGTESAAGIGASDVNQV
jgi:cell division protease FtsH